MKETVRLYLRMRKIVKDLALTNTDDTHITPAHCWKIAVARTKNK